MAVAKRHIHKYHRKQVGYEKLWACALPTCNHYMPKHIESLVEGKASICWKCEENMVLDPINMKSDKPLCLECSAPGFVEQLMQEPIIQPNTSSNSDPESKNDKNEMCNSCGLYAPVPGNPDGICYRCWLKTQ